MLPILDGQEGEPVCGRQIVGAHDRVGAQLHQVLQDDVSVVAQLNQHRTHTRPLPAALHERLRLCQLLICHRRDPVEEGLEGGVLLDAAPDPSAVELHKAIAVAGDLCHCELGDPGPIAVAGLVHLAAVLCKRRASSSLPREST